MQIAIIALVLLAWPASAQAPDPAQEAARAQAFMAAGKVDEAIRIYQELVRTSADNPILLLNLCIAEYTAKRYREAATNATSALRMQPDLLAARLFLGASQLELGEFPAAIESLRVVVAANPRERNARLMLGEALLEAGKPAAAVEHLEAAAGMLPTNPRVWYGLGRVHEALGQVSAANQDWERLMALPTSLESHLHMARVHTAEHRWREAASEWRDALQIAPEKPAIRVSLAQALFRSRDYRALMAALTPLLTGDNAEVQFLYGASLLNIQQPLEALPYLRTALARDPRLLSARAALGQALLQIGKAEDAVPLLEAAVSADEDGSVHFQLFRAYQLMHKDTEARRALTEYQRFRASLAPRP